MKTMIRNLFKMNDIRIEDDARYTSVFDELERSQRCFTPAKPL